MKFTVLVALFTLCCFMSSCSDDLSRGRAQKLIVQKAKLPLVESESFEQVTRSADIAGYEKLQSDGYINFSKCLCGFGMDAHCSEFTDKGKPFITGEGQYGGVCSQPIPVRVAELEFGEVTGIRREGQSNTAIVSYTLRRKNVTPFGVFLELPSVIKGPDITFTKYDDGWRITN